MAKAAKKKPSKSPTQKALHLLRAHGWHAEIVEHWNSFAGIRQDLMGFIDVLAFNPRVGCPTLAVQVTAESGVAARVTKILAEPRAAMVLRCGWRIEVWGTRKTPVNGSGIKARTLLMDEDGTVRVVDGSLALEAST